METRLGALWPNQSWQRSFDNRCTLLCQVVLSTSVVPVGGAPSLRCGRPMRTHIKRETPPTPQTGVLHVPTTSFSLSPRNHLGVDDVSVPSQFRCAYIRLPFSREQRRPHARPNSCVPIGPRRCPFLLPPDIRRCGRCPSSGRPRPHRRRSCLPPPPSRLPCRLSSRDTTNAPLCTERPADHARRDKKKRRRWI